MLITRECDYAVRILRALSKTSVASVQDISAEENIPIQYTYKICRKLLKAEILSSHRGASGGYELRRSPADMTLLDVFGAVDNDMAISECINPGSMCSRNTCDHPCRVHVELCRIQNVIKDEISSKKLSELF